MRKTHIKDGAAITKLMYFLKHWEEKDKLTEMDIVDKIEELRGEQEGYIKPSFDTIAGYAENGRHSALRRYGGKQQNAQK